MEKISHKRMKEEVLVNNFKNGNVFDKVGVNFSEVRCKFNKKFKSQILGAKKNQILGFRNFCCCSYEKSKNSSFAF